MSQIKLDFYEEEFMKTENTLRFVNMQLKRLTEILNRSNDIDHVPDGAWEELDRLTIRRNALMNYINKLINDRFEFLTCHPPEIKEEF